MTDVRVGDGLVCGIGTYPQAECAAMVDEAQPTSSGLEPVPESTVAAPELSSAASSSPAAPLISGLALLVAAIIGTLAWRRRDRG